MEQLASKLPTGVGYDWTGMSYQERLSGNRGTFTVRDFVDCRVPVSGCAVRELVDSVLRYASRSAGVIGALLAATFRGLTNDVYFRCRPAHNHWFVGEERDTYRRIRQRLDG